MARPRTSLLVTSRLGGAAQAAVVAVLLIVSALPIGAATAAGAALPTVVASPVAGTIVNFAGSPAGIEDLGGYSGDGGPAVSAALGSPLGMAADTAGNVYIVDNFTGHVRKVDAFGVITNFAGNSPNRATGNGGDGGLATAAELNSPEGVAVDAAGNVYIVDTGNARVRKVDTRGIITNFAGAATRVFGNSGDGGPATAATFAFPTGVAVDATGNVYIVDESENRVRKVDTKGIITNFAGSADGTVGILVNGVPATSPSLHYPVAVAVDPSGNVYIADGTDRVRKVDTKGTITTFAGITNTQGATGDGGPATAATLQNPNGLAADSAGNVYISDFGGRVRKVDTAGSMTTFAGRTQVGDEGGNLGDGGPATSATLGLPQGVAVDAAGNIYISDGNTFRVREVLAGRSAPGQAEFTFPLSGQSGIDSTRAFTWATIPEGQGYILVVGTSRFGTNLVNSGILPPTQTSYATPILPPGQTLYATLLTEVNGAFTRFQTVTFTAGPAMGRLSRPVNGQTGVATPSVFTWSTIAGAQNYILVVGSTRYGTDLVNSGILAPSKSAYNVGPLPAAQVLYATLLTEVNGTWTFQLIAFIAS